MSDGTAPSHLWVTEDGALSHHRPSDHTAVQYTQTGVLHSEAERLRARVAELEALLGEARDNALASTAEKDISDERRAYRRNLYERLQDAALAAMKGDET